MRGGAAALKLSLTLNPRLIYLRNTTKVFLGKVSEILIE